MSPDETWFTRLLDACDAPSEERARFLAGIAVSQAYLADKLSVVPPQGMLARIKARVAEEGASVRQRTAGSTPRRLDLRVYRWPAAVLAAAAALAFSVIAVQDHRTDREYTPAIALAEYREDDFGELVAMLNDDVDELLLSAPFGTADAGLDELHDDIDAALADIEEDDWL